MLNKQQIQSGMYWSGFDVLGIKIITLVSGIIVTRMLVPEQFGVWAASLALTTSLAMLSTTGMQIRLIQKRNLLPVDLHTAWTIELIKNILLFFVTILVSSLYESLIGVSGVRHYLIILSFSFPLVGVENIGIQELKRNIQSKKIFVLNVLPELLGALFGVITIVIYRDIIFLAYTHLFKLFLRALISYQVSSFRPRLVFNTISFKDLFSYGKWMYLAAIVQMIRKQGIIMLMGGYLGAETLGLFNRASAFSVNLFAPYQKLYSKYVMPVFAHMANNKKNPEEIIGFSIKYSLVISTSLTLLPIPIIEEIVLILLGDNWAVIIPLLKRMLVLAWLDSLFMPGSEYLLSIGLPRERTFLLSVRTSLLLILIYPTMVHYGVIGIINLMIATNVLINIMLYRKIYKVLHYTIRNAIDVFSNMFALASGLFITAFALDHYSTNNIFTTFGVKMIVVIASFFLLVKILDDYNKLNVKVFITKMIRK